MTTISPLTTQPSKSGVLGSLAVLFAALLWGTTGTAAHFNQDVSPLATGAFAMGVGGLLQAVIARPNILGCLGLLMAQKCRVLLGAVCVVIYPLAFYSSMHLAGVAIGTVITIATAPLAAAILERLFGHHRLTQSWYLSLALGIAGVVMMALGETGHQGMTTPLAAGQNADGRLAFTDELARLAGIALGIIAGVTYAAYSLIARRMMEGGIHARAAMGSLFGVAGIALIAGLGLSMLVADPRLFATAGNAGVALYMALVPMFLGYLAFGYGLKTIAASKATLLTLFELLVAALLAVTIVGEHIAPLGWLGMVLIAVCLVIQVKPQRNIE
ncbi:DMT family transporter [Cobetia marina]|uniref:DMT family transporter n=1 Tax=Cobetia marina TaxID=28258 RepID=UPI00254963D1|nr:EamA family transporter [Cobetia pacifica]MDI6003609.1 EamA family transporter [Cobetia pacifica]